MQKGKDAHQSTTGFDAPFPHEHLQIQPIPKTWAQPSKGLCIMEASKIKQPKHCGNRCSIPLAEQQKSKRPEQMAQPPKHQKGLQVTCIHGRTPEGLQVQQEIAEIEGFAEKASKHHGNRRRIPVGTRANSNPRMQLWMEQPPEVAASHFKTRLKRRNPDEIYQNSLDKHANPTNPQKA